jgi:biotin operon repressor
MNRGYVKVWRKIEDSGLIQLPNTLALFMHLLLNATHKARKVGTPSGVIELKRGQFISGRIALASRLEQTERQVRTSITRLEELGIISIQTTNKFSIYTIENYNKYQDSDEANVQQNDQQVTNNRPADDQQTTTKQELNNLNIKEVNASVSNKVANCPYDQIIINFNNALSMLPAVKQLTDKRKKAILARWKEDEKRQSLEWWDSFFGYVAKSDFLTGRSGTWSACCFDWIFKAENFVKIIEGNYENKS